MLSLLLLASSVMAGPAFAQTAEGDLVIMRRVIAPANLQHAPSQAAKWEESGWTYAADAKTCSDAAPQVQTVSCKANGVVVADALCRGEKPASTRTLARYEGCTTDWAQGGYGEYQPSCGPNAVKTQTVQCLRTGGDAAVKPMDETLCVKPKPSATVSGDAVAGCSYAPVYGSAGTCTATTPGSTTGTRTAGITACNGTGSDGKINPVQLEHCAATQTTACTLTYEAAYSSTYGACTASGSSYVQTAPITSCTAKGSDGSSSAASLSACSAQTVSKSCYPGTWTASTTKTVTTCTAKKRDEYYAPICTKPGGIVDSTQASCDPAIRPDDKRTTVACNANCGAFTGGYYYNGDHSIGTVTASTDAGKQAAAKDMCEKYVALNPAYSCTLKSSAGTTTGSVFISDSYLDTFVSGPANYYYTSSCRTN